MANLRNEQNDTAGMERFIDAYDQLTTAQRAPVHRFITWSMICMFFKQPSRDNGRAAWDAFTGLVWPDISPVVLPALALILAVLVYAAIGGRVDYAGDLVKPLAAAGCLAGAFIGYKQ